MSTCGYSVDRGDFCKAGGILDLMTKDPYGRPLLPIEGVASADELARHLHDLFQSGLSMHGWEYFTTHRDFVNSQGKNYAHYETALELILEFVRRDKFPQRPSRLQSYFAWDNLEAAIAFNTERKPIFRVEADAAFHADQVWLRLSNQGVAAAFSAHQYWSGAPSKNPRWEFVMVPPVRILERVA